MRSPQPSLSDRSVRVQCTLKDQFLIRRREHPYDEKEVGVGRGRRDEELCRYRSGYLDILNPWWGAEGNSVTQGLVGRLTWRDRVGAEARSCGVEIQACPTGARERPLTLSAFDQAFRCPNLQLNRCLALPPVV